MLFMHAARWRALWIGVLALLRGEQLWLTALGRARPGATSPKHAIKAIDRLLGNKLLHTERRLVYRALAEQLVRPGARPVIIVDTVEVRAGWFGLVATVPFRGRSFPIHGHVTRRSKPRGPALVRFLRDLKTIVPEGCRPVLLTDAGFESPWFEAVEAIGWDYVGRVRNNTQFLIDGTWTPNRTLHRRATNRAKNLGLIEFPKSNPKPRRLVLAKKPTTSHRRRRGRSGRIIHKSTDRRMRQSAREPWLLATSLTSQPSSIVTIFALRMRIEQTFRDAKNFRWGLSLRHAGSRTAHRLEILLLIGAIATFILQVIGFAAENLGLQNDHQANTERRRRVISIFVLGTFIYRHRDERVTPPAVAWALAKLLELTSSFAADTG
jgi:hypothetical protein